MTFTSRPSDPAMHIGRPERTWNNLSIWANAESATSRPRHTNDGSARGFRGPSEPGGTVHCENRRYELVFDRRVRSASDRGFALRLRGPLSEKEWTQTIVVDQFESEDFKVMNAAEAVALELSHADGKLASQGAFSTLLFRCATMAARTLTPTFLSERRECHVGPAPCKDVCSPVEQLSKCQGAAQCSRDKPQVRFKGGKRWAGPGNELQRQP